MYVYHLSRKFDHGCDKIIRHTYNVCDVNKWYSIYFRF